MPSTPFVVLNAGSARFESVTETRWQVWVTRRHGLPASGERFEYRRAPNRGGFALFAAKPISADETVLEEPVIVIPEEDWKVIRNTVLHEYCFEADDAAFFPLGHAD